MNTSCYVCGVTNEKSFPSVSDNKGQVKNIHRTLDELEIVKEENDQLKKLTELKLASSNDLRMGNLKARYIELLHRKEKLQEKIGKHNNRIKFSNYESESARICVEDFQTTTSELELHLKDTEAVNDNLQDILQDHSEEIYLRRMQAVLSLFRAMNVEANPPLRRPTSKTTPPPSIPEEVELAGISSILSVPILNSGDFSYAPVDAVATAVGHIAHLVDAIAAVLNVPLPHPLHPHDATDCIVSAQHDLWAQAHASHRGLSLVPARRTLSTQQEKQQARDFDWTPIKELTHTVTNKPTTTENNRSNPVRTNNTHPSHPAGTVPVYSVNPHFSRALVLLQADIIMLCLRAGMVEEDLWPAEAMLLNLDILHKHCERILQRHLSSCAGGYLTKATQGLEPLLPVVYDTGDSTLDRAITAQTLSSLEDRYGSRELVERAGIAPGSGAVGGYAYAGEFVDAQFDAEESGLDRENEWDLITVQGKF